MRKDWCHVFYLNTPDTWCRRYVFSENTWINDTCPFRCVNIEPILAKKFSQRIFAIFEISMGLMKTYTSGGFCENRNSFQSKLASSNKKPLKIQRVKFRHQFSGNSNNMNVSKIMSIIASLGDSYFLILTHFIRDFIVLNCLIHDCCFLFATFYLCFCLLLEFHSAKLSDYLQ